MHKLTRPTTPTRRNQIIPFRRLLPQTYPTRPRMLFIDLQDVIIFLLLVVRIFVHLNFIVQFELEDEEGQAAQADYVAGGEGVE